MDWKVGSAKQQFSALLKKAAKEPQLIHNRTDLVAVVVGAADATAFLEWRGRRKAPLATALAEARVICADEEEDLVVPPRIDRPNPVLLVREPRARRHQRRE